MTALIQSPEGARTPPSSASAPTGPSRVIPNAEIVEAIDSSDEWIQQRSGIKQRRWAAAEETVQMMAVAAAAQGARRAPASTPGQIDCVMVATVTPPATRPPPSPPRSPTSSAPTRPAAFDISAACAGFCHGVALASDMVRGGSAELRPGDRRRAALRPHRRRRPRHRVHLRRRRRRRGRRSQRRPRASARSCGAPTASSST